MVDAIREQLRVDGGAEQPLLEREPVFQVGDRVDHPRRGPQLLVRGCGVYPTSGGGHPLAPQADHRGRCGHRVLPAGQLETDLMAAGERLVEGPEVECHASGFVIGIRPRPMSVRESLIISRSSTPVALRSQAGMP